MSVAGVEEENTAKNVWFFFTKINAFESLIKFELFPFN